MLDTVTNNIFPAFSCLRLLSTGSGICQNNNVASSTEKIIQDRKLLEVRRPIKSFALCTAVDHDNYRDDNHSRPLQTSKHDQRPRMEEEEDVESHLGTTSKQRKSWSALNKSVEPFLVRSYIHPLDTSNCDGTGSRRSSKIDHVNEEHNVSLQSMKVIKGGIEKVRRPSRFHGEDKKHIKKKATVNKKVVSSTSGTSSSSSQLYSNENALNHYLDGTSNMKLSHAFSATTAVPGLFDRVCVKDSTGRTKMLADGGICSNCPIAVALKEAQSLWPNRTIGVVLSLGLDSDEDDFAAEAIDIVREKHPDLYYERFILPNISKDFKPLETDRKKLEELERKTEEYMNSPLVQERIKKLIEKIYS